MHRHTVTIALALLVLAAAQSTDTPANAQGSTIYTSAPTNATLKIFGVGLSKTGSTSLGLKRIPINCPTFTI